MKCLGQKVHDLVTGMSAGIGAAGTPDPYLISREAV